jgi:hypothetical protein
MRIVVARLFPLVFALLVASTQAARADTASDLVAKNLAARGGADKLAAISSIQFTGKVVVPGGFELAYRETRMRKNNAALYEMTIQSLTIVQGYDGTVGWRINPFEGRRDAERMSADDTRALSDDATVDGPLLSAKATGATVTYLGREDYDGTDAYKLRVVDPTGAEYQYYLDPDSYLEIRIIETRKLRGARQVSETELGDYELVNGVYFPFSIASGPLGSDASQRQVLTIAAARANLPLNPMMFAMPSAPSTK